jgi:NADPH2:quinone reductase
MLVVSMIELTTRCTTTIEGSTAVIVQQPKVRALVFDGPALDASTTRVAEIPVPVPGTGQVSIDVHQAGVNFKDVMARRGDPGYVPDWPFVPGLEVAGTVRALGAEVEDVRIGDLVVAYTGAGGLAEVAIAEVALTVPVPRGLELRRAAAAPGALVTAALLVGELGRVRPGETVLVLGTVGSPGRVAPALASGYDEVLVRSTQLAAAVHQASDGRDVDLILDPQGTAQVDLDLQVAAPGARIILFGNATGEPLAPLPALGRLFAANASIAGFSLAAFAATAPARLSTALTEVLGHLVVGDLDIELTSVNGLDEAAAAQQALAEGRGPGKQVVELIAGR